MLIFGINFAHIVVNHGKLATVAGKRAVDKDNLARPHPRRSSLGSLCLPAVSNRDRVREPAKDSAIGNIDSFSRATNM